MTRKRARQKEEVKQAMAQPRGVGMVDPFKTVWVDRTILRPIRGLGKDESNLCYHPTEPTYTPTNPSYLPIEPNHDPMEQAYDPCAPSYSMP